ncbi:3-methyl-2-oxobutanoate hydroxymethyltransferase [Alphaproteobacteria bacterium]|nr:3-methyl-2-oxobutanoate hydroxymethyltransferase [Alphaproteobacteria bacterium]
MARISLKNITNYKNKKKIVCLTAYTSSIAKIIDKYVDIILIGDSLGTAIYGMKNTQSVTIDMMKNHGLAVSSSSKNAYTIIDMPYQSYRNKKEALINAKKLLSFSKCQSVKLETDNSNIEIVKYLVKNGINVVTHIGVTPQKFKDFKKIRSVGKTSIEKDKILNLAINLQKAGSCLIILECINENLAKNISLKLQIPTIGIGASPHCDGQVLVINDILNFDNLEKKPKFIKSYTNLNTIIKRAVKKYSSDVTHKKFPKTIHTY